MKAVLRDEQFEQLKIQRMRQQEEERKKRFFNDQARTKGLDLESLNKQIAEKEAQKKREMEQDVQYCEYLARTDYLLEEIERQKKALQEDRRKKDFDINEWQKNNPHLRREFYLNDPNYLKNDRPSRVGDEDPNVGVSSLQRFDGEDLKRHERIANQRQEMQESVHQALSYKQHQKQTEREIEKMQCDYLIQLDQKLDTLEQEKQRLRKEQLEKVKAFNLQKAAKGKPSIVVDKFQPSEDFFAQFNKSSR